MAWTDDSAPETAVPVSVLSAAGVTVLVWALAGCIVAFAGAAVIGLSTSHHTGGGRWGAILCIVAATWMIYLGLAPTAIGFLTWAYARSHTEAGRMGSTTYLVPPVALLLGWAMLGEIPPLLALPGGILCLAGVALTRWSPRRLG